jgi:hypothetical protein
MNQAHPRADFVNLMASFEEKYTMFHIDQELKDQKGGFSNLEV